MPRDARQVPPSGVGEAWVGVGYHELDALEASIHQLLQERRATGPGLAVGHLYSKHLTARDGSQDEHGIVGPGRPSVRSAA